MQLAHGQLVWRQDQYSPTSLVAKYNGQLAHGPLVWQQEQQCHKSGGKYNRQLVHGPLVWQQLLCSDTNLETKQIMQLVYGLVISLQ